MTERIFFWLKSQFGFSRKESRGFLLVVPILLLVFFIPRLVINYNSSDFEGYSEEYLDSLLANGWEKAKSDLTYNPQDTIKGERKAKSDGLTIIPFSEADSVLLQIVPGIGTKLAGRIIKYRENLGGFVSQGQLLEVYGLSPEVVENIWDYFDFAPENISKIRINSAEIDKLSTHPYISYGQAKVIVAYRKQHGAFQSAEDLKEVKIFDSEWIKRLSPYLDFSGG